MKFIDSPFFLKLKRFLLLTSNKVITFIRTITWKNLLITLIFICLLCLLTGLLSFNVWVNRYQNIKTPDIRDMLVVEAIMELQKYDLKYEIESIYSSSPYGQILKQDPAPGKTIKNKRVIRLIVSKGPFIKELEDFSGKSEYYLQKRLIELSSILGKKLELSKISYEYSDAYPKGTVISQVPAPGTDVLIVTGLEVVISNGPLTNKIIVDSYLSLSENEAKKQALSSGLIPVIQYKEVENIDDYGIVVEQSIEVGTTVTKNTQIILYVGKRKE